MELPLRGERPCAGDFNPASLYFRPSRTWRALTPFVPVRHANATRAGVAKRDRANGLQIGSPEHDCLRLLALVAPDISAARVQRVQRRRAMFGLEARGRCGLLVRAMTMRRRVLLVDNGSLEPASTLQLRRLAAALAARVDAEVDPVSLAHSAKIPAEALEGRPAELFPAGLERLLRAGECEIVVVPLFIGPSHAITRWLPALVAEATAKFPSAVVRITPPLHQPGDRRLAEIVTEQVRGQIEPGVRPRVALVDHGSPARGVGETRDEVAAGLRDGLGDAAAEVIACSMERREEPEFDFNEPTLEHLLARPEWRSGPLVVALLFIAPGRHAGPDGDVAQIVRAARGDDPAVRFTALLGAHPRLIEILADRVRSANGL